MLRPSSPNHQTLKFRVEASWLTADTQRGNTPSPPIAPELSAPTLDPACACEDISLIIPTTTSPPPPPVSNGGGCCGGGAGAGAHAHAAGPVGEGAEGGCCSSSSRSHHHHPDISGLTVPLASASLKADSFDAHQQKEASARGAAGGSTRRSDGGGGAAAAWLERQRRPGGAFDVQLLGRDAARCVMTFVTTALSYLLMLAAMSFHVAIFFAVCCGVAVGAAVFGRFRSYVAVAHQDRCCG